GYEAYIRATLRLVEEHDWREMLQHQLQEVISRAVGGGLVFSVSGRGLHGDVMARPVAAGGVFWPGAVCSE
ncbi:hypothetical protein Q7079_005100, partial [Salmonella enterica]|nr:hypothetical protein [Salmonella enterica]